MGYTDPVLAMSGAGAIVPEGNSWHAALQLLEFAIQAADGIV
jgi:hypothetical protein